MQRATRQSLIQGSSVTRLACQTVQKAEWTQRPIRQGPKQECSLRDSEAMRHASQCSNALPGPWRPVGHPAGVVAQACCHVLCQGLAAVHRYRLCAQAAAPGAAASGARQRPEPGPENRLRCVGRGVHLKSLALSIAPRHEGQAA